MLKATALVLASSVLFAAKTQDELIEEARASGRFWEVLGYVVVSVGLLMILLCIPLGIIQLLRDRRKKARKRAHRDEPPDEATPDAL